MTHLITTYLKKNRKPILFYVVFLAMFYLVLYLYGVRADALGYAVFLSLVTFTALGIFDFWRYQARIKAIGEAFRNMPYELGILPAPLDIPEEKYQEEVRTLGERFVAQENEARRSRQEMIDFYSLWAHQIKTPIAAMRLLLQNEDIPAGRQLKTELLRIEQYVEMVLCYFRLDSPSSDFVLKYYSLNEIIRQSIRKFAGQFIQKKLRLIYEPTDRQVLTDEKWLSFVLDQLLSNALKYTSTGGITISVDENLVLSISDTGIGIAPEDLPRIFERSYTGYNGRAEKSSTGLGLYLCRKILLRLSHPITVSSEVGKGSTFSIDLSRQFLDVE